MNNPFRQNIPITIDSIVELLHHVPKACHCLPQLIRYASNDLSSVLIRLKESS
jgi:hypothetical protein